MPFLNALMPWATSPINSEILPRPNSRSTTPITTIQCQRLMEPIGLTLRNDGPRGRGHASRFSQNLGLAASKNKDRRSISPYDQWAQSAAGGPLGTGHSRAPARANPESIPPMLSLPFPPVVLDSGLACFARAPE